MHYIVIEIFTRDDGLFRSKRTLHANLAMHDSQQYRTDIDVFVSLNCLLSFADSLREWLAQSLFIRSNEEIHRLIQKTKPHYWSDKGFKGTVTNPTLTSLHGESLEITLIWAHSLHRKWSCISRTLGDDMLAARCLVLNSYLIDRYFSVHFTTNIVYGRNGLCNLAFDNLKNFLVSKWFFENFK